MTGANTLSMLWCAALLLGGCGGFRDEPDPLGSLEIAVPEKADGILVSLRIDPDRRMQVTGVEPVVGPEVKATYLGYLTRCGGLCGVHAWDDRLRDDVRGAVEGTVPIEIFSDSPGPHLLFLLEFTPAGRRILDDGECLAVLAVDLERAEGSAIRVTRQNLQFLWAISHPRASCLERVRLVR